VRTLGVVPHVVHAGTGATQPVSNTVHTARGIQPAAIAETRNDSRLSMLATPLLQTVAETQRATLQTVMSDDVRVRLFADPLLPPVALHVIGAGRGAEAFARIAASIGWQVTIVDHRPALLESLSLPAGVTCRHARPEQVGELVADAFSAVALMTHIFEIDRAWLEALLPRHHGYLGVLGSRQRAERLLGAVDVQESTPLHAPIGLDIGGESPESIALATIAEIHAVMHARPGGPLRERRSPIHDRTPVPVVNTSAITVANPACRLPE
jgi:xanthine/CO dehydrogenase XdhC/CoxF family maturation factor